MLDVNQTVNELLVKISNTLTSPDGAQTKDLQDIVSSLQKMKSIDKTLLYTLFEDTIEKIKKAAESFDVPEKETKELVDAPEDVDREIKSTLDEIENPKEKAAKYNEIVNAQLDYTIKTIQDVIDLSKESEKSGDTEIKMMVSEQTEKIMSGIVLSILGTKMKNLWTVKLSSDKAEKGSEEVDLNERKQSKLREEIDLDYVDPDRPVEPEKSSDQNTYTETRQEDEKSNDSFDLETEQETKEVQKIGSFPSMNYKERHALDSTTAIPKTIENVDSARRARLKIANEVLDVEQDSKNIEEVLESKRESEKNIEEIESTEKSQKKIEEVEESSMSENKKLETVWPADDRIDKSALEVEGTDKEPDKILSPIETTLGQREYRKDYLDPAAFDGANVYKNDFTAKVELINLAEKSELPAYSKVNEQGEIEPVDYGVSTSKKIDKNLLSIADHEYLTPDGDTVKYTKAKDSNGIELDKQVPENEQRTKPNELTVRYENLVYEETTANPEFDPTQASLDPEYEVSPTTTRELYSKESSDISTTRELYSKESSDISRDMGAVGSMKLGKPGADRRGYLEKLADEGERLLQDVTFGALGLLITSTLRIGPTEVRRFGNKTSRWFNTIANAKSIMNGQAPGFFGGGEGRGITDLEMSRQAWDHRDLLDNGEATIKKVDIRSSTNLGTTDETGTSGSGGTTFINKNIITSLSGGNPRSGERSSSTVRRAGTVLPKRNADADTTDLESPGNFTAAKPEFASAEEGIVAEGNFTTIKGISTALDAAKEAIDSDIYSILPKNHRKGSISIDPGYRAGLDIGFNGESPPDIQDPARGPGQDRLYIRKNSSVGKPGVGKEYDKFQERTAGMQHNRGCTGWLNVYPQRAIDFTGTQGNDAYVIPFQFEPVIAGDSKSADYSQVSTLGRSQAAQVYRRSTERNINLTLNYIVVDGLRNEADKTSQSADGMQGWSEEFIYEYIVRNLKSLVLPNVGDSRKFRLGPPIIQVWYGGVDSTTGSSANVSDDDNSKMNEIHPMFRTNWIGPNGHLETYRSLWVAKDVTVDYKEGIVNRNSRNKLWAEVSIQLTEIAPSVVANQIFVWNKQVPLIGSIRVGAPAYDGGGMALA